MKAIVNTGPDELSWKELPVPIPQLGQVRIRTAACGICATDLQMIAGWSRTGFPAIPGHEWSGLIDAVGPNVNKALIGKHCVGENVLSDAGEVGFEHPGGYGEYFITEAKNIHSIPDNYPMEVATLIEPLAVAIRGINKLDLTGINNALVFGDGPIGLLVLMILTHTRVENICLVGGRKSHLHIARNYGASLTINYHDIEHNLRDEIARESGHLFPIVVEASGSSSAIQASMELVRRGGQLLVLGDYANTRASFKWNHLLHHEIRIFGSNASADAWPEAVRLAASGSIPVKILVTQSVSASNFKEGLDLVRSKNEDVIKVVLDWMI